MSRSILLAYLVVALGGVFCIEQPRSSRLVWFPRFEFFCATANLNIYWTAWWQRHYGSLTPNLWGLNYENMFWRLFALMLSFCTLEFEVYVFEQVRKRHIAWSNCRKINFLDRGKLLKQQRDSCIVKSTVKKKKADGSYSYSGNKHLKSTQTYPISFGLRILRELPQLWSCPSAPPSPRFQDAALLFQAAEMTDWSEAQLLSACIYLRGNKHLKPTKRWKNAFPEAMWEE